VLVSISGSPDAHELENICNSAVFQWKQSIQHNISGIRQDDYEFLMPGNTVSGYLWQSFCQISSKYGRLSWWFKKSAGLFLLGCFLLPF
jgi:hypothetical protein